MALKPFKDTAQHRKRGGNAHSTPEAPARGAVPAGSTLPCKSRSKALKLISVRAPYSSRLCHPDSCCPEENQEKGQAEFVKKLIENSNERFMNL